MKQKFSKQEKLAAWRMECLEEGKYKIVSIPFQSERGFRKVWHRDNDVHPVVIRREADCEAAYEMASHILVDLDKGGFTLKPNRHGVQEKWMWSARYDIDDTFQDWLSQHISWFCDETKTNFFSNVLQGKMFSACKYLDMHDNYFNVDGRLWSSTRWSRQEKGHRITHEEACQMLFDGKVDVVDEFKERNILDSEDEETIQLLIANDFQVRHTLSSGQLTIMPPTKAGLNVVKIGATEDETITPVVVEEIVSVGNKEFTYDFERKRWKTKDGKPVKAMVGNWLTQKRWLKTPHQYMNMREKAMMVIDSLDTAKTLLGDRDYYLYDKKLCYLKPRKDGKRQSINNAELLPINKAAKLLMKGAVEYDNENSIAKILTELDQQVLDELKAGNYHVDYAFMPEDFSICKDEQGGDHDTTIARASYAVKSMVMVNVAGHQLCTTAMIDNFEEHFKWTWNGPGALKQKIVLWLRKNIEKEFNTTEKQFKLAVQSLDEAKKVMAASDFDSPTYYMVRGKLQHYNLDELERLEIDGELDEYLESEGAKELSVEEAAGELLKGNCDYLPLGEPDYFGF